jgi:Ras-related protein Rab-7A
VVIGASGVGKTSLRSQVWYLDDTQFIVSDQFFTSTYLPVSRPTTERLSGQTLLRKRSNIRRCQISLFHCRYGSLFDVTTSVCWANILVLQDTAGQERFSSLSSAFFRGADAAILMFDVNDRRTLHALRRWWEEFRDRAPVLDEDAEHFCCVVVGNKVDLVGDGWADGRGVGEEEAKKFVEGLIPIQREVEADAEDGDVDHHDHDHDHDEENEDNDELASSQLTERPSPSQTISIVKPTLPVLVRHASRSVGTHTALSIYHTPSSSLFDQFYSARASPEPSQSRSPPASPSPRPRMASRSGSSNSSGLTITPALFAQPHVNGVVHAPPPPPRDRGPRLFYTSARTGEGVQAVFEYVAKRVVRGLEDDRSGLMNHSRVMLAVVEAKESGCC